MDKAQVGKCGENVAARYLRRHGYTILERNVHLSHEEIDLIAANKQYIAFVEVKTRTKRPEQTDYQSSAAAAVTYKKQEHLLRAASAYMQRSNAGLQPRMDVIEVYLAPDADASRLDRLLAACGKLLGIPYRRVLHVNHIQNAFGLHGYKP